MASPDTGRADALSRQLADAHQQLRHRLAQLRANLHDTPAPTLGTHCLAFCSALTTHHRGEDTGLFTELLAERPDLTGTVAKLVEDHTMIAAILARVAELAGSATSPTADPIRIGRELDGLTAILESHFAYEERALRTALDAGVPDTGWSGRVLHFDDAG